MQLSEFPSGDTAHERLCEPCPTISANERIKLYFTDPDDIEDESNDNEATFGCRPISPCRYSDIPFTHAYAVDPPDIALYLEQLCREEMTKAEWGSGRNYRPFAYTDSTEEMVIYLDDNTSKRCEGVEVVFMQTSGLGMNTAMLDECRAGRGPRPQRNFDLLASLRKGTDHSVRCRKQAAKSSTTAGCDPSPTVPSYREILQELEDWNNQIYDSLIQNNTHLNAEEEKAAIKKDLSLARKELNPQYAAKRASLQARLKLSVAADDTEETARLGKEERSMNQNLYEACKEKVLRKIGQEIMHETDKRLEELQDLAILYAAQKSVLTKQFLPTAEIMQSCEDQHTLFIQNVQQEFQKIKPHEQTLESFTNSTRTNPRKPPTRTKKMFAPDEEDTAAREGERTKRLGHPGTFGFMHRARNDNNTIQDITQPAVRHCDGLSPSLQAMMETFKHL
ncbi:hypothetical protein AOQ84DRAFT_17622 [Glonium stellatum]|uniref:Uncharacterized protein n=1 Tax=Glonium stellatum TaxID=574774 RepID=A0A8E2FCI1_9PEZI|nr:hypothetical protein AOQ84DRAFT_17622 [Glonium stellatum]